MKTHVYVAIASFENDRPQIDFERPDNASQDWNLVNHVIDNRSAKSDLPIEIVLGGDQSLNWDFYELPGTLGIVSQRALDTLGPFASAHFRFVKLVLDKRPYYLIKAESPLDCLDRDRSILIPYRHDPNRIKEIDAYAFKKELIVDPLIFCIPEEISRIFATDSIPQLWQQHGLRGLKFEDAEPPGGYRHPALRI